MKIAFIGLGNMGGGMAANLAKAGHEVRAFDLSEEALARAAEAGCIRVASAPEAVVEAAEVEEAEVPVADDTAEDGAQPAAPAKKKTRRGTRGGRSRKKKPAAAAEGNGAEPAGEPEAAAEATSDEYVPMSEWIEDFDRRA